MAQRYTKRNRDPRYQAPTPPQWPGILFMAAVIFFAILVLSGCANAQDVEMQVACGPIEMVVDMLEHEYNETMLSQKEIDGLLFEVWSNDTTGTWTLLMYPDDATACVVDEGSLYLGTAI